MEIGMNQADAIFIIKNVQWVGNLLGRYGERVAYVIFNGTGFTLFLMMTSFFN